MRRTAALSLALCCAAACGGGNSLPTGPSPVTASIQFDAVASACAGPVSVLPSWWGFVEVRMHPMGERRWAILFENVPIGQHTVRLSADASCGPVELSANGTRLKGLGSLPGFEFTLHADGTVTD